MNCRSIKRPVFSVTFVFHLTPIFALVLTVTKYKNLAVGGAI